MIPAAYENITNQIAIFWCSKTYYNIKCIKGDTIPLLENSDIINFQCEPLPYPVPTTHLSSVPVSISICDFSEIVYVCECVISQLLVQELTTFNKWRNFND